MRKAVSFSLIVGIHEKKALFCWSLANFLIINGQTFTQITDILDKDLVTVV